jgi:hypothetical protein
MFEDLIAFVMRPSWVWRATPCEYGKTNAIRNVGSVVLSEDGICQGYFNSFEVRFAKHYPITEAIYLDTLNFYAGGLPDSRCRFVIVREEVIGNVSEVIHVKVFASSRIKAQSHHTIGNDRTSPIMALSVLVAVICATLLLACDPSITKVSR